MRYKPIGDEILKFLSTYWIRGSIEVTDRRAEAARVPVSVSSIHVNVTISIGTDTVRTGSKCLWLERGEAHRQALKLERSSSARLLVL